MSTPMTTETTQLTQNIIGWLDKIINLIKIGVGNL